MTRIGTVKTAYISIFLMFVELAIGWESFNASRMYTMGGQCNSCFCYLGKITCIAINVDHLLVCVHNNIYE